MAKADSVLSTPRGYTPEQAKALEQIDIVRKATVQDRRDALRIVGDPPVDK
jgi:hypothetical protein